MKLCLKCGKQFPIMFKIDCKYRNLKNRKFCLDCSPFGLHNTRNISISISITTDRYCVRCRQTKTRFDFYQRRGVFGASVYCKLCTKLQAVERCKKHKQWAVEYKGGKCVVCNYSSHIEALEFHHRNPFEKDFDISRARQYKKDRLKAELDKCDLVCCRCHREIHANIAKDKYSRRDSNPQLAN